MSPRSHEAVSSVAFAFDAAEAIVFVDHPSRVRLETSVDVDAYFDAAVAYWRREARGERVYFVVSYDNFSSNPDVSERYAERVREVLGECALGILRHGGDVPQRTTARRVAIMLHVPSNLYQTREDAIEVVRGLRGGSTAAGVPAPRQSGTMAAGVPAARASRPPKRRQSRD
jgi:hypothetical protein